MKTSPVVLACVALAGCGKLGVSGGLSQLAGNWAEVKLPPGCDAIAAESGAGVAILCADGRVFH